MMPLYEYYCDHCDRTFEALRSISKSAEAATCPVCGREADRILPTTFASMSHKGGWRQRVPFHHAPVRAGEKKAAIARVKPKEGNKEQGAGNKKDRPRRASSS